MKDRAQIALCIRIAVLPAVLVLGCLSIATQVGAASNEPKGVTRAIERYCTNVRDIASEARFLWHHKQLEELGKKIDKKIAELEERTREYKKWYDLRNKFSEMASEKLVKVYSQMRPDAAAEQLATMPETAAAAIVFKLKSRKASVILNEMDTTKAARISMIIADSARKAARVARKAARGRS